jgi:cell division protein FtsQ
LSKHKISVTVYEKSVAGCVEYMNQYIYFDKDGLILESSSELIAGIPCIKGLNFTSWEIGEKLPVDDSGKFQSILSITQLIDKYELDIDGIKFTAENEIILIHDNITIELGEGEYLAIQMMNLGSILEGLDGMSGTLYMKDFNSDNATASFSAK